MILVITPSLFSDFFISSISSSDPAHPIGAIVLAIIVIAVVFTLRKLAYKQGGMLPKMLVALLLFTGAIFVVIAASPSAITTLVPFEGFPQFCFGIIATTAVIGLWKSRAREGSQQDSIAALTSDSQSLIDATPHAMLVVDDNGTIIMANGEAETLFEYGREELVGRSVEDLVPTHFRPHHAQVRREYQLAPTRRLMGGGRDLFALTKDREEIPVEIGLSPFIVENKRFTICAIANITERTEREKLIQQHTIELQRSNRELDDFAYVASHDLKAPLRAIDNLSKWVWEDCGAQLPPESRQHLELLQQRVQRMEQLLNDLLEYSRAGREQASSVEVNIEQLVSDIVDLISPPASMNFEISSKVPVVCLQKVPLEQVLRNLIGNAIKHHNRQDGKVTISARTIAGNFLQIAVQDDGPGIEKQHHERIFEMFKTLRPRDVVEGSGIGLAVVRKLVQHVGGNILLESQPGAGSTFSFSWPYESVTAVTVSSGARI